MAGVEYTVTVDDADLRRKAARLLRRLGDLSEPMLEVREVMLNAVHDRFESESAPDGNRWRRLSPATLVARRGRGKGGVTILRASGRLIGSIAPRSDATSATVGTNVVHGAIHQFGGQAGRGHKVTIPARPYLGFGDREREEIDEILTDWVAIG